MKNLTLTLISFFMILIKIESVNFIHHLIIPLSRLGGLMMILLKLEKKFKASLVGLIIVKNLFLKDNKRTIKLNANI